MILLVNILVVVATVAAMEWIAWATHRYIMHGWGWGWHRSHHEPHDDRLEANDLYAIVFAALAVLLFWLGSRGIWPLTQIGLGMTIYGALYFVVHDGLVHQRWPFHLIPHRGYLKRLVQAHRLHHAVEGRERCVSFGFLYAPPIDRIRARLRDLHGGRVRRRDDDFSEAAAIDGAREPEAAGRETSRP